MTDVLVAADSASVTDEVTAALEGPDARLHTVRAGIDVLPAVLEIRPELVVLDLQIGNMGGMAACMNLRLEEGVGRLEHVPVLMLLDRRADVFLAKRSGSEGWLVKPLDPIRLRTAAKALLAGGTYHDPLYQDPVTPISGNTGPRVG
jgi:DNA-binding response OmpR family regulator